MSRKNDKVKAGFTLSKDSDRLLDALAFTTGRNRSDVIEEGIRWVLEQMPSPGKDRVMAALELNGRGP